MRYTTGTLISFCLAIAGAIPTSSITVAQATTEQPQSNPGTSPAPAAPPSAQPAPTPPPAAAGPPPSPVSPVLPVKGLDGLDVFSSDGQQVGKVAKVNVASEGKVKDVEVHSAGFFGFFSTAYVLPAEKLTLKGGRLDVAMTSEQVKQSSK